MSHTPGPWEINRYSDYEGYSISADGHGCIAERWYPTDLDEAGDAEMAANARLIVAAPGMLAALKQILDLTGYERPDIDEVAQAAIAKAEGQ